MANSRFPSGMTERKARATAKATRKARETAKATAGPSTTLRFAQDDSIFLIRGKSNGNDSSAFVTPTLTANAR
jgi:hypothetical protein